MRIHSIRLKNIKSYGAGPSGDGVTIPFGTGVNRVAGRNGNGKTTLIECIGYALFLAEPQSEEYFKTDTYFLSHGATEGEIELTFTANSNPGDLFRIHRTLGRSTRRRSKIIQVSDQSLCAEGDQEVAAFLCRILNLPTPDQLSEVFAKLVGVKQGRLAWPFDSKPGEARSYFEPLLGVQVFRDCFDRLKESVAAFESQRHGFLEKQAAVRERIQDRANAEAAHARARHKLDATQAALQTASRERETARIARERLESQAKAIESLRAAREAATTHASHAHNTRVEGEARLNEARAAAQVLVETAAAHQAHRDAVAALAALEGRRELRDRHRQQLNEAESARAAFNLKAAAAREQAAVFLSQRDSLQKEHRELAARIDSAQAALEAAAASFQELSAASDAATVHREILAGWIHGLAGWAKAQRRIADTVARLSRDISGWNASQVQAAEALERKASENLNAIRDLSTRAAQKESTLVEQLRQISNGLCPFLKETCRQFDPAIVQADLQQHTALVASLKHDLASAIAAHQKAAYTLVSLREAAASIAGKEAELAQALATYASETPAAASPAAIQSTQWLSRWDPKIPLPPALPGISLENLTASQVAGLQESAEAFTAAAQAWWRAVDEAIRNRLKEFQDAAKTRAADTAALQLSIRQRDQRAAEIQTLIDKAAEKSAEAGRHDQEVQQHAARVGQLNDALLPFAALEADLKREQQRRDAHRPGHDRYLGASETAADLPGRQARFDQMQAAEMAAREAEQRAAAAVQAAETGFDPKALTAARQAHQSAHDQVTTLQAHVETDRAALEMEERRLEEWKQARLEEERISAELGRCDAAIELTELARKTLRDTAPAVAQQLCNRIAVHAQRIFNQINPEPIELEWSSERYSLTIQPGDRRFAMLSGGEQTKLALSMTLAMIDELSDLRFCSFDEPTYGVDAESRPKLADAIVRAQEAAGLDQLLIISHDDAFEGHGGHAILLNKSATGTQVELGL